MRVLRLELAGEPIRVIEVAPGMVKTEGFAITRFRGDRAKADAVYAGVVEPLVAEDIAEAIVHAVELPGHVNLDLVTVRPVAQAAAFKVIREPLRPKALGRAPKASGRGLLLRGVGLGHAAARPRRRRTPASARRTAGPRRPAP